MRLSRRKFSAEFKLRALRQVEAGASVAAVARRHEIHPTLLSKWRQQLRRGRMRGPMDSNSLYYGDNLDILRRYVRDESPE